MSHSLSQAELEKERSKVEGLTKASMASCPKTKMAVVVKTVLVPFWGRCLF